MLESLNLSLDHRTCSKTTLIQFSYRFLRSTALEFQLDDEVTSNGVIAPRFLDEIADEVDIIEDKKAPPFRKCKIFLDNYDVKKNAKSWLVKVKLLW